MNIKLILGVLGFIMWFPLWDNLFGSYGFNFLPISFMAIYTVVIMWLLIDGIERFISK